MESGVQYADYVEGYNMFIGWKKEKEAGLNKESQTASRPVTPCHLALGRREQAFCTLSS